MYVAGKNKRWGTGLDWGRIGDAVAALRERSGLSVAELSRRAKSDRRTWERLEGGAKVSRTKFIAVAQALGVSPDELEHVGHGGPIPPDIHARVDALEVTVAELTSRLLRIEDRLRALRSD